MKQILVCILQYLHLMDSNPVEFDKPFALGQALADKYRIETFHVGQTDQFVDTGIVPDIAFHVRMGFTPFESRHTEQGDIQHIGFAGIDSACLLCGRLCGNEILFEFLDLIVYDNQEYVVLLPAGDDGGDEVVILRLEEVDDETEAYNSVEDEDILNAVFEIFKEKFKDEFNFIDE